MFFKVSMMFFCLAYSYVDIDVRLKQNGIYDPPRRQISNEILKKEDDGLWRSRYENGVVKSEGKFIRK